MIHLRTHSLPPSLPLITPARLTLLFLFLQLYLSSACPPSLPTTLHTALTRSLTFTPTNTTVALPPHSTFHLLLKSNPSTGYTWSLHPSSTTSGYRVTACAYKRHVHGPGMVGVGGEEVWEVEAGGVAGEWRLALQYQRAWEGDKKEADVVWTVQVTQTVATMYDFNVAGTTAVE